MHVDSQWPPRMPRNGVSPGITIAHARAKAKIMAPDARKPDPILAFIIHLLG